MTASRKIRDFSGLLKMAAFGAPETVGDFMHSWSADLDANARARRIAFDRINGSGLNVKSPAARIPWVVGGGIAGREAAKYLGAGPFWRGVATIGGALYGNSMYNDRSPDPRNLRVASGIVSRGW